MSRIGGLVGHREAGSAAALLPHIAAALPSAPGWTDERLLDGAAALAWSGAKAPNSARDGRIVAVVDGVFYNREELPAGGNDAGRLVALYRRFGFEAALQRINGDFAVALYDAETGTLWLARDRLGLKPLYYADRPGYLAFASRPRALLALPGLGAAPNRRYVALFASAHYRVFDNAPEDSPFEDISQLPAGTLIEVRGGVPRVRRWWSMGDAPDFAEPAPQLAEQYRALLLDAVSRRVRAFGRPAFTLSGGLDSSSVLSSAVAAGGERQHAWSTVYADATYDERDEIRPMLADKVAEWHAVEIGDEIDVFDLVGRMIEAHDEPVATATWLSHYVLAGKVAEAGFDSLFGGLGGDELNAGEYEYFIFHFADLAQSGDDAALAHEIACWARHHDHPVFRKSPGVAREAMARLADPARPGIVLPDMERLTRYRAALDPAFHTLNGFAPVMEHPFASALRNRTWQDLSRETTPCCLRAEDRQCTAFGLDRADPFLDHRLVEFMFRVPGTLKIRDGITKRLLREAMRGILPEETRTRIAKTGWNAPAHRWFTGRGLERLRDMVSSRRFRERGIWRAEEVERLIDEHAAIVASGEPRENHMMFLWQTVNLETWLDGYAMPVPVRA